MEARSFCRTCQGFCGTILTLADGRIAKVRGDPDDPMSHGYLCAKGRQAPEQHHSAGRLLQPLLRDSSGVLRPVDHATALAATGERLRAIVAAHGPGAIGFYIGTQALFDTLGAPTINAFAAALGTPRVFGTMTIDQSAKWIAAARLGDWHAGGQSFDDADVWALFGSNPPVSTVAAGGAQQFVFSDPARTLKRAKARGMQLIVVDPRRSDIADHAAVWLQPRPGTDAFIAAGMLRVILDEVLHDAHFCAAHVDGVAALHAALARFTPAACADAAGVSPDDIVAAARLFARGPRGMAGSGTGPNMAQDSNLAEHLIQALNVVCGRFPRAGERVVNPGVLYPERPRYAEVQPWPRSWEAGPFTRGHGTGPIRGQMMTAELTGEILPVDATSMRALICVGGNPLVALPDQARAGAALEALDCLIVLDPRLSATARRAHVVFPSMLQYERADSTWLLEKMFHAPFGHVTPPVIEPPAGVCDDAETLRQLAAELRLDLGQGSRVERLAALAADSRVPFATLRDTPGGTLFPDGGTRVLPARADAPRFQLLPPDVARELAALRAPVPGRLTLITRRHREVMNSTLTDASGTIARYPANPAYLHPDDLARLGLAAGERVVVAASAGRMEARTVADPRLRPGTLAMGHCWSGDAADPDAATNRLVHADAPVEPINRMPRMTGIPVSVERA